jgi:nucleotide-binding universal stress UspA family protein
MTTGAMTTIVVGVDGTAASRRAVEWCAEHAHRFGTPRVVVVHAVHLPHYAPFAELGPVLTVPVMGACERDRLRAFVTNEWCRPLRDAAVAYEVMLLEGSTAVVLRNVAAREGATLVVTGQETLDELVARTVARFAAHLECPLVVIP